MTKQAPFDNGWFAEMSYPWIAAGFGQCNLWNVLTGEVRHIHPEMRCQAGGWIGPTTLIYYTGEDAATIYSYDVESQVETLLKENFPANKVAAGSGSWGTGYPPDMSITLNGTKIDTGVGWRMDVDGDWLVSADNNGLHVYRRGLFQRLVTFQATCKDPLVSVDGYCGYGYNGPPHLVTLSTGEDRDVTVTPTKKEGAPIYIDGWIWTASEYPSGCALGRPVGDLACIIVPVNEPVYLTVQKLATEWAIATHTSTGALSFTTVALDTPRHELPPLPPDPTMRDPHVIASASPTSGVDPLVVTFHCDPTPDSGTITTNRLYVDGLREDGNDPINVQTLNVGKHDAYFRVQALNGVVANSNTVTVTVSPKLPEPPIPPVTTFERGVQVDATTGPDWLSELVERKVTLARVDMLPTGVNVAQVVSNFANVPAIRPLYLCSPTVQRQLPDGAWIEVWNNTGGSNVIKPADYAKLAIEALQIGSEKGQRVYIGCLDNMNDDWLDDWFPKMIAAMGTAWARVEYGSVHWYPDGPAQPQDRGHNGRTRSGDVSKFLGLIGARKWLVTECGYHNAPVTVKTGWGKSSTTWQLNELDVLNRLRQEDRFWSVQATCQGWVVYQLLDAPMSSRDYNKPISRYGWREGQAPYRYKMQSNLWL